MNKINYKNREINLDECHSIKVRGMRFQINHIENKGRHKEATFIELNSIDDTEEYEKVAIYVNANNIDTVIEDESTSPAKKAFFEQQAIFRAGQDFKKEKDAEDRLKAMETLIADQAKEINKLKNGEPI